ncbi:MAG TPA: radical SAM protein [Candidatus Hydrogenedentes bacterium]|nr:radical SAM protein [Candidatus Hydrogenedentota bacterium]
MGAIRILSGIAHTMMHPHHPGQLVLFVTDRCNCRCPMCFNADNVFSGCRAPDLPLENILAIARSLKPLPQLLLSGGEPFLRKDIPEIVRAFHRLSHTSQVSIPTNATQTNRITAACEQILQECPKILLNINLSLDGIGETHDAHRQYPGCYEKLCATYEKLAALRERYQQLTVNIITVISERNVKDAASIIAEIREKFSPNYHALGLLRNDTMERESSHILDAMTDSINVVNSEKESFTRLPAFSHLAPAVAAVVKRKALQSRKTKTRCFKCLAGSRIIVITNDGRLMPCEPLWLEDDVRNSADQNAYCMAFLEEFQYNVKEALKSDSAAKVRDFVKKRLCWCTYACAIQNGILYSPTQYILLIQEMMRKR